MGYSASAYDAWLTTQPEEPDTPLPGDPGWPRCACGAFLRLDPDSLDSGELTAECTGGLTEDSGFGPVSECGRLEAHDAHPFTEHGWTVEHRTCKRCGADNAQVQG